MKGFPDTVQQAMGFVIEQVLADSLYGESGDVIRTSQQLKLPYIVVIRSIELRFAKGVHGVLMPRSQRVRYNQWQAYDQPLAATHAAPLYPRDLFGMRRNMAFGHLLFRNS